MKKILKKSFVLLVLAMAICLAITLTACNGGGDSAIETPPDNSTTHPSDPQPVDPQPVDPQPVDPQPVDPLPTAAEVVAARLSAASASVQNYDFKLNLNGNFNIGFVNGDANANYDGKYRFDKASNKLGFYRKTSGALLYDSQEYIVSEGNSRIKIKADENNNVKKVSVMQNDDDGLTLINLPFVSLVDALKAENITKIQKNTSSNYKYVATIALSSENAALNSLFGILGRMDADISFKDISITNPNGGIKLYFNIANDKLADFSLSMGARFPVKGVNVAVTITYEQHASNTTIDVPSQSGVLLGAQAQQELTKINAALEALKTDAAFSLDIEAKNDFDPGWNVKATVDRFVARMYKNTYDDDNGGEGFVAFNTSFKYVAHTETDGKEAFNYTLGNITIPNADTNKTVYLISRKGSNAQTPTDATFGDVYNGLTSLVKFNANELDCVTTSSDNGESIIELHINNAAAIRTSQNIVNMINSNPAPEDQQVLKVDNYFNNSSYSVVDVCVRATFDNNNLTKIELTSEIIYNPTSGDYSENNVTLKNSITLDINKKYADALEYKAPKNVDSKLGSFGLNNSKFYIL